MLRRRCDGGCSSSTGSGELSCDSPRKDGPLTPMGRGRGCSADSLGAWFAVAVRAASTGGRRSRVRKSAAFCGARKSGDARNSRGLPHCPQKRLAGGFSVPQDLHLGCIRWLDAGRVRARCQGCFCGPGEALVRSAAQLSCAALREPPTLLVADVYCRWLLLHALLYALRGPDYQPPAQQQSQHGHVDERLALVAFYQPEEMDRSGGGGNID